MNEIFVVGHRNPDTDSIVAAMSYAALRNALGDREYTAACLGHISDETQRMLDKFGFEPPRQINDVRTQVRDLDFDTPPALNSSVTMNRAWRMMREQKVSVIPVINEDGTLHGTLSAGDIASYSLLTIIDPHIDDVPLYNVLSVLEGKILNEDAELFDCISGNVVIALPQSCDTLLFNDPDSIVLCGDQPDMVERARNIHHLHPVGTAALGRTLCGASLLGEMLKEDNAALTLRIQGGGPIGTILAVSDNAGNVRGYVSHPEVDLPIRERDGKLDVSGAVGREGLLTVSRDIGLREPYSGSSALVSGEIAEDLAAFLTESDQLGSACALGVLVNPDGSVKAAGGFIMQLMPNAAEETVKALEDNIFLMDQLTTILDEDGAETVIAQVFKGLEWHKTAESDMAYKCYCSRERVLGALASLSADDLASLREEKKDIEVRCQFCDAVYNFTPEEIAALNAPEEDKKA